MADSEDVDRFLWELEQHLSHLDGEERRGVLREAEGRLHQAAETIARDEGAQELTWYHYVQATAELGPPERLAAELTGAPLPDKEASRRRMWALVGVVGAVLLVILAVGYLSHGELETVGSWSGQEQGLTDQRTFTFNVSQEAESVFLNLVLTPATANSTARITILDGETALVLEDAATVDDHLELVRYVQGQPGTWRVLVDFQDYTGGWRIDARQELP